MKLGIYVHIPYCVKKCRYCDFESGPIPGAGPVAEYFKRLRENILKAGEVYGKSFTVDSVFFGGGTPSLAESFLLCGALEQICSSFTVEKDAEISLEANPGTITEEKLSAYRTAGFNRISIGVQSFDDEVLRQMGRIHDSEEAVRSIELAKKHFENINLDLMLGVPAQSPVIWRDTLERALSFSPQHISFYSLQLEEGTPFYEDYRSGRLELPSWDENRAMYHEALRSLDKAGYHHYEISNAAKPGFECRHNIKYWTMQPYLGFGSAAHSFIGGKRFENGSFPWDDKASAEEVLQRSRCFADLEEDVLAGLKGDFVFTQLRLIEGLDKALYERLFGSRFDEDFAPAVRDLVSEGLLSAENDRLCFTRKGLDFTNPVMERLLNEI